MLNIVLFGPPGAGKGTQSQKLIEKYGLTHLSTGDILRSEIARGTALGMEAKQLMDKGDLVGDDIVIGMIEAKIDAEPHAKGFIFDGFPRTQAQAVALDDLLQKKGTAISAMLALEVDNEELIKRLLLRGKESGRPDDQNEEIIRNRVNEYNNKTLPLKKYYSEQAKFHSINGIGTVDAIFNELCERIVFVKAEIELTMLENDIEHLDLTINDFEVATEISEELKHDIAEVRKTETKKEVTPKAKPVAAKKVSAPAKKIVAAAPKKKTVVAPKKKTAVKKAVKRVAAKKLSRPGVIKKATTKKTTKKVAPKKAVKSAPKKATKVVVKKKIAAKKIVKKAAPKKIIKKVIAKKPIKKVVAKKPVKKVAPKKALKSATQKVTKVVAKKKAPAKKVVKKKK
jgi:adenylate kinase